MVTYGYILKIIGLLALATTISLNYVEAITRPQDAEVMNQLKQAWTFPPKTIYWEGDPCMNNWTGVSCDNTTQTMVTEINLQWTKLSGSIPPSIGGLTSLSMLELSQNPKLVGIIPKEIGRLKDLTILSLQFCGLSGRLPPELGNLTLLGFLGLNGNNLSGSIPPEIGRTNLTWFDISQNEFTGTIPVSRTSGIGVGLDNLTAIVHFHMFSNNLTGSIPAELFTPRHLLHFLVNDNNLSGSLPNVTNFPSTLEVIRVDDNGLVGTVPADYGTATSVNELNFRKNRLSGQLPDLSNLNKLRLLDLSENDFDSGPVPLWVLSLKDIQTLALTDISLTGAIPAAVFNYPWVQSIDLSSNNLTGALSFNGTTGLYLAEVKLDHNDITGLVGQPTATVDNEPLALSLEGNPICQNSIIEFIMACNESQLQIFKHPGGRNCGSTSCSHSKQLNPNTCACSHPLELAVELTAPTFTDVNNETISLEKELAAGIGLNRNQTYITNMTYEVTRHVFVYLSVFPPVGEDRLSRNMRETVTTALQQHLFILPQGPFVLPLIFTTGANVTHKLSTGAIVGIVIGSLLALLIVSASIFFAIFYKRRADKAISSNPFASWGGGSAEFGEAPKLKGARWFSLAELKTYTDNWSDHNQIGVGGYGRVYQGVLPTGDLVAIKRATEGSMQGANEFKTEIELLSRVHHRNLLSLIGFCYEGGEQALIYEFMSNGTLEDHLKGKRGDLLSWDQRLAIALGSAKGIAYLHDHASPPIIHRDIKPANILLNDRMVPKVADFGLSKLAPDEGEKLVQSVHVKGTLGYLDPEYYMTNILTDKSDVYSFGIVLLEILTSRPPIDMNKFVVREVRTALDKGGLDALRPVLDPAIRGVPKSELDPYLAIALECVEENATLRPTISTVVKRLEALEMGEGLNDGRKVRYADEPVIINDEDNAGLLKNRAHGETPERFQRQNDQFAYSGSYNMSATVRPK